MGLDMSKLIEASHLFSTLAMVGVIWIIQVVHYPMFANVGRDNFAAYEQIHQTRISFVVIPFMLTELATAILLFSMAQTSNDRWLYGIALGLLGVVWASTFFLQVPQHAVLSAGYDEKAIRFLVLSNWIRTIAWTARGFIVTYLTVQPAQATL